MRLFGAWDEKLGFSQARSKASFYLAQRLVWSLKRLRPIRHTATDLPPREGAKEAGTAQPSENIGWCSQTAIGFLVLTAAQRAGEAQRSGQGRIRVPPRLNSHLRNRQQEQ